MTNSDRLNFLDKINKNGPVPKHNPKLGKCHIWTGATRKDKYGNFNIRSENKTYLAHRFAWILKHKKIPKKLCVLHHCDNPSCVNTKHLFLGSLKDNTQDMLKKRRHVAILTKKEVLVIRSLYKSGKFTQELLGLIFGVSRDCVADIVNQRTWIFK